MTGLDLLIFPAGSISWDKVREGMALLMMSASLCVFFLGLTDSSSMRAYSNLLLDLLMFCFCGMATASVLSNLS